MTYIARRISVIDDKGVDSELLDSDFFSLTGPLIVLGEPGAGKSELAKQFAERSGSSIFTASSISLFPSIEFQAMPKKIVVDGVDEITAYQNGAGIIQILDSLKHLESPNFVLTCRAVDWQAAVNAKIIQNKWRQYPIVGTLLPLSDQEVIDFVNSSGDGYDGSEFVRAAKNHDVAGLLRNPQNLSMLIKAVKSEGWPSSRSKLYENACKVLVTEDNEIHDSLNTSRPSDEKLIDASGFICAQLLLSGKSLVCVDGNHFDFPKISDLATGDFSEAILRDAISSKVFRATSNRVVEPCHRTIAEFLGAKWISKALADKVSQRRLEALLYGTGYIVPTALRGFHAWLATLSPNLTIPFIERDPYGCFRYGDPAALSVSQSRHLLSNLERLADNDPYFRSEDWHVTFGRGLAKPELREDILKIVRNSSTPTYLSHLVLESIRGDSFALTITEDLIDLLCSPKTSNLERRGALAVLQDCVVQPDWKVLATKLKLSGDLESLELSLDILESNGTLFDGNEIADILINFQRVPQDSVTSHSIGYSLGEAFTVEQLDSSLEALTKHQSQSGRTLSVQRWILRFAKERLQRQPLPSPATIVSWLDSIEEHDLDESQWKKFSEPYFSKNLSLRQSIQTCVLSRADSAEEYRSCVFLLGHRNPGLWLRENDFIHQADNLVSRKAEVRDWIDRWVSLVEFAKMHGDFKGDFDDYTKSQAEKHPELAAQLADVERRRERASANDEAKKWERKHAESRMRQAKQRHDGYRQIADMLKDGVHLGAASEIAKAYLGYFNDFDHKLAPEEKVAELVGSELQSIAIESLKTTISKTEIPTPRKINELHAVESKEFLIENVLVAHGHMTLQSDPSLSDISSTVMRSMLASCRWGLYRGEGITSALQDRLEELIFKDLKSKEDFLRDSFEPYLEVGANHISGLYRFAREDKFFDIAGELSIEWIEKYDKMSDDSFNELLTAAIQYAPRHRIIEIVRIAVSSARWGTDEKRKALWLRALFLLDFENHVDTITVFANEAPERIWSFRDIVERMSSHKQFWLKTTDKQNHFLISTFGPHWRPGGRPSGWSGDQNPWDAADFIQARIRDLASSLTDIASELLGKLVNHAGLAGYHDYIKHLHAQQMRGRAEANKKNVSLTVVRNVLLQSSPTYHEDLQAILIDQLVGLQERIQNSPTNDVEAFWDKDCPRGETYCRDRIGSALNPYLERYGVRLHTEGTMPNNERCDLLGTHGILNLPIEIKGQWHGDIWTAAEAQLNNYTQEYRAEGWGIYLVLWFGYLGTGNAKNPRGWSGQALPETLEELNVLLQMKYSKISSKTKIFVLDLSKS